MLGVICDVLQFSAFVVSPTAPHLKKVAEGKRLQVAPPLDQIGIDIRALRARNSASVSGSIRLRKVAANVTTQLFSRAEARGGFIEDLIPGLRSLRSLTRGYYLSSLRDLLSHTFN